MNIEKPPKNKLNDEILNLALNSKVKKLIKSCNLKYYYWDKVKQLLKKESVDTKSFWMLLKLSRNMNSKNIKFDKYKFTIFTTNKISKQLHILDIALLKNILSNKDKAFYIQSAMQEEAIASTLISGASTTRIKVKDMLRKNEKPLDKYQQMVLNNYNLLNYIKENKNENISKNIILKLHSILTNKISEESLIRKTDNLTVNDPLTEDTLYSPPKQIEIDSLLEHLYSFFNNEIALGYFIHPIVKALIVQYLFSYIHPFEEGNGRIARALTYWYLIKSGYSLAEYISISRIQFSNKENYMKSFLYSEYDNNDLTYFIEYNLTAMIKAKNALSKYIERKEDEKNSVNYIVRYNFIPQREAIILNEFNKNSDRVMTVKEVQNLFSISNQTARTALDHLVEEKYITSINLNKKKKGYILIKPILS